MTTAIHLEVAGDRRVETERFLRVYTGKVGVGKTCVAAAMRLLAAARGYRTIVLSTNAAHRLDDSFDMPLGPEPTPVESCAYDPRWSCPLAPPANRLEMAVGAGERM
ncbi:MAG: ArsA-related P-loop ATPase [Candidatus Limnocylindrales bacterium]|jgi:hypothetical protein